MTVFKTFLKVLNKNKGTVLLYTIILIVFGTFSLTANENTTVYTDSKAYIAIVNNDDSNFTTSLIDYLHEHSNITEPKSIEDALFYRDISYVLYIPKNYGENFLEGKNPSLEYQSTQDYYSTLASMMVEKYINTALIYKQIGFSEEEIIDKTNSALKTNIKVDITSKLDSNNLQRMATYYNFLNYSMLAGLIMVVALIMSSFKNEKIKKRTIISGMNYKKYNKILYFSNSLFAICLWLFYVILSIFLIGNSMLTPHGLIYICNSFIFTICTLSLSILISELVPNKNALNGIINVIALGSSFLCGSFVPMEWLPKTVLSIAHILPSYWFIKSNETIKTLEAVNFQNLKPILINMGIIIIFTLLFVLIYNIITKHKRKIA